MHFKLLSTYQSFMVQPLEMTEEQLKKLASDFG